MKKLIVLTLSMIVIVAIAASWYNVSANRILTDENSPTDTATITATTLPATLSTTPYIDEPLEAEEAQTAQSPEDLVEAIQANQQVEMDEPSVLSPSPSTTNSKGNGWRQSSQSNPNSSSSTVTDQENITLTGIVDQFISPQLTLITDLGQVIYIQLGNLSASDGTVLDLIPGEYVTVTGWYNQVGEFTANQITLNSSGITFTIRNQTGRPDWAGKRQGKQ